MPPILDQTDSRDSALVRQLRDELEDAKTEAREKNRRLLEKKEALHAKAQAGNLTLDTFESLPEFKAADTAREEFEQASDRLKGLQDKFEALVIGPEQTTAVGGAGAGQWLASALTQWKSTLGAGLEQS